MTEVDERSVERRVSEIIGQTAGYVSMCWNPRPGDQVFDSEKASAAVESALEELFATFDIKPKES